MTTQSSSEREPVIDRLGQRVKITKTAALEAVRAATWICSDGHRHRRPSRFTHGRLCDEVNRRNPGNDWTSAEISLGVYQLVDEGRLVRDESWWLQWNHDFRSGADRAATAPREVDHPTAEAAGLEPSEGHT